MDYHTVAIIDASDASLLVCQFNADQDNIEEVVERIAEKNGLSWSNCQWQIIKSFAVEVKL